MDENKEIIASDVLDIISETKMNMEKALRKGLKELGLLEQYALYGFRGGWRLVRPDLSTVKYTSYGINERRVNLLFDKMFKITNDLNELSSFISILMVVRQRKKFAEKKHKKFMAENYEIDDIVNGFNLE